MPSNALHTHEAGSRAPPRRYNPASAVVVLSQLSHCYLDAASLFTPRANAPTPPRKLCQWIPQTPLPKSAGIVFAGCCAGDEVRECWEARHIPTFLGNSFVSPIPCQNASIDRTSQDTSGPRLKCSVRRVGSASFWRLQRGEKRVSNSARGFGGWISACVSGSWTGMRRFIEMPGRLASGAQPVTAGLRVTSMCPGMVQWTAQRRA